MSKREALFPELPGRAAWSGGRGRAEGLLAQSEGALRQLFDMSPSALILSRRADFAVVMVNEPAERMFGVSRQCAVARHVFVFFPGTRRFRVPAACSREARRPAGSRRR